MTTGHTRPAFVWRRLRQLAVPAAALLVVWLAIGAVAQSYFGWPGMGRVVRLVVSPLWFFAVYLMLIALLPVSPWLHRRYSELVLVWLAGAAMCVDVLRFRYGLVGWYRPERSTDVTAVYWVTRRLALVGPLLCTLPVIWLFGRRWVRAPRPAAAAVPTSAD